MADGNTNLNPEAASRYRQSLLKYPDEMAEVDYKATIKFRKDDDFALDLVKHILGMANAGGGYLVIGYKEDANKKPQPDPSMTQQIAASYDSSILASYVEKHVVGTDKVSLTVYKEEYNSQQYPIIRVEGFDSSPFFCRSTKSDSSGREVLKEGALYFRVASARTIIVASPTEWDQLINWCVEKRQDEFLRRFTALAGEMGFLAKGSKAKVQSRDDAFKLFLQESRQRVTKETKANDFPDNYFEVAHTLVAPKKDWDQKQLLEAAEKGVLRRTGWPIGVVLRTPEGKPKPTSEGIEALLIEREWFIGFDYWRLDKDGSFYQARVFEEDTRDNTTKPGEFIYFDTRIWRIAEAFEHCTSLYEQLAIEPSERILLSIQFKGLKGRVLRASDPQRYLSWERRTSEDVVTWETETTQDLIQANLKEYVREVANKLFLMFEFLELSPQVIDEIVDNYKNSRT